MDHYLWIGLCLFYDIAAGARHVYNCGTAETANGEILWHQMGRFAWISGAFLLYFRRNYVPGKADPGKTCVAGKIEAAEFKLALSR